MWYNVTHWKDGDNMVSEAQKRSRDKWDAEHMSTLGCKIKKEDADVFRAVCAAEGKTINAVLAELVKEYIEKHKPSD